MLPVQTMSTRQGREGEAGEALGKRSSCMALGESSAGGPRSESGRLRLSGRRILLRWRWQAPPSGWPRPPDSFKKRSELKGGKRCLAQSPLGPHAMDRGAKSCRPPCPGRLLAFQAGCARAWPSALGPERAGRAVIGPTSIRACLPSGREGQRPGHRDERPGASRLRLRTDFEQPFRAFAGQGRATAAPLRATAWPAPVGGRLQKP